jgi:hypothetical protein
MRSARSAPIDAALVNAFSVAAAQPVLGVAVGSLAGLLVNFTISRHVVFRGDRPG